MTVSSMGMFASGLFSFLACKVFKLSETVADDKVGAPVVHQCFVRMCASDAGGLGRWAVRDGGR